MQEIKDENRLIGRICRGELLINREDIENLESANSTELEEEYLKRYAQEINETVERNQKLRNELREKTRIAQENSTIKAELENLDKQIEELKVQYDKKRYTPSWKISLGALLVILSGVVPGLIASIFTSSFWVLTAATCFGFFAGLGINMNLVVKTYDKCEDIKKDIKELEFKKLALIEQSQDLELTEENEIKTNILKNINNSRSFEVEQEDGIEFEITI